MDCTASRLPYRQAGFSKIVVDYVDQAEELKPFYQWSPSLSGVQGAIESREKSAVDRSTLLEVLRVQYGELMEGKVAANINALASLNTFTVTTAHQPNILTGPLYFIYKIFHAIKLSDQLNALFPSYRFVPVYYMGSEDADLEELGYVNIGGSKLVWDTKQTGAVGRMKVDAAFLSIIHAVAGQLGPLPFSGEILEAVKQCYREGATIQDATFRFVHFLFKEYGLVVLIPDSPQLKRLAISLFADDLTSQRASQIVGETITKLEKAHYKVQAHPREINLFYLIDDKRERIVESAGEYKILNSSLIFTREALLQELQSHPERFSPNVILRGLFQELVLPNVVFIGGGGELAYWMQYKELFAHYGISFPVLVLRNSFLLVEQDWCLRAAKLGFSIEEFFQDEQQLLNRLVKRESTHATGLNGTIADFEKLYADMKLQATAIDVTLSRHVDALKKRALDRLTELEKKMLRAERRKFGDSQRKIHAIRAVLFPGNGLQERHDNLLYYYARWGQSLMETLYEHSLGLEQEFVILCEK